MPPSTTRRAMSWRRVAKSVQALAAHASLLTFSLLLVLKLDHVKFWSWWIIFFPLWLFHAVVARGRFSLPAPSVPHNRHWAPCHAVVSTTLLVTFELLLCIYLESSYVFGFTIVNLKLVFTPLLALEITILVDNFRMCKALMPGEDESINDDAIWETLPHFWVAISMVFFIAGTMFTLCKLAGSVGSLGWWDLFINFGIAECFSFLVCTKWSNPIIHNNSQTGQTASSSTIRYVDWNSGLIVSPEEEDQLQENWCGLQDIGGHIMKIPIIAFQVLLCMRLEDSPAGAKNIPIPIVFSPVLILQIAGVLFASSRVVERLVLLLRSGAAAGTYFSMSSRARDCFMFLHHGSRLLGWWSIDERSQEEQARIFQERYSGCSYNTFCGYPPEIVKKMPKKDLAEEVWRLQAALGEQTEITKHSQNEYERLKNEKVLCRVCFEEEIGVVLLPCRHRVLCSKCCDKCEKCPMCRNAVEERLPVFDI